MLRADPEDNLAQVYLRFVAPVRSYLYRLSGDPYLAEDLVQETFYRAMRQFLGGAKVTYISAWLYRIARNLYLDHAKHAKRMTHDSSSADTGREASVEPTAPASDCPEAEVLRKETEATMMLAISLLPEKQRTALILRDIQGLKYEEMGEVMGTTLDAVKSSLYRARRSFAEVYRSLENGARDATGLPRKGRGTRDA